VPESGSQSVAVALLAHLRRARDHGPVGGAREFPSLPNPSLCSKIVQTHLQDRRSRLDFDVQRVSLSSGQAVNDPGTNI
jgi:hypothetical protein